MERIANEHSLFAVEQPQFCPHGHGHWRTIVCDYDKNRDVIECNRCGAQRETTCNFDDDFA